MRVWLTSQNLAQVFNEYANVLLVINAHTGTYHLQMCAWGGVMMPFWKWSANWISTMLGPYRHVLPIFLTTHSSSFSLNPLKLILILWPLLLPTVVYIMVGQLSYHLLIFTASSTFISYLSPLKRRYISMHQHLSDSSSFVLWWSTNIVPGISFLSPLR